MKTLTLILISVLAFAIIRLIKCEKELHNLEKEKEELNKEKTYAYEDFRKCYRKYVALENEYEMLEKLNKDIIKNHSKELKQCTKTAECLYRFKLKEKVEKTSLSKENKDKILRMIDEYI